MAVYGLCFVVGCLAVCKNVGYRSGGGVLLSVAVVSCCFFGGLGERLCAFLTAFDCCVELTLKNFTIYNGVVCEKCVTFVVGN